MVKHLNAQFVGGRSAAKLEAAGGDGFAKPNTGIPIDGHPDLVAKTGKLPGGVYYVTASALLNVVPGDAEAYCRIARGSAPGIALQYGGEDREGWIQATETVAVKLAAGDSLQELCEAGGNSGSTAYDAGIIAIRIASSQGTAPATAGRSGHRVMPPGQRR